MGIAWNPMGVELKMMPLDFSQRERRVLFTCGDFLAP